MQEHGELSASFIKQLELIATELEQSPLVQFGYRERVRIERPLFLVLREVCHNQLGHVLHGLTNVHHDALYQCIKGKSCGKDLLDFIRHVFELHAFLLELSSTNPYVQGDALSRVSLTKRDAAAFVVRHIRALVKEAHEVIVGRHGRGV